MAPTLIADGLYGAARTKAMLAVALAVLISVMDYTVVNVALPSIAQSIHSTDSASIWVVNAYQLASVISLLPVAAAGDRLGHARLCRFGLVLFLVASVACAMSRNLAELTAARALQGLGSACILGVNVALVRYIYPANVLGRGIALNGLVIAAGVAIGPTVAAAVLAVTGWPWLFFLNVPLGGAALVLACAALPRTPIIPGRFDVLGTLLLAAGLGVCLVGLDSFAHARAPLLSCMLLALGALFLAVMLRRQAGQKSPLLPVDLLALSRFRAAFLTGFTAFVASNFFIISMPFNLMNVLHRGPVATGLLITPWPVAIVTVAPVVGRLADRFTAASLSTIGLLVTASGFLALYLLPADPSDANIAWRIFLAGAGFGIFQPPNNKAMMTEAPASRTGSASGMVSVGRLLGQTIGGILVALTLGLVAHGATSQCLLCACLTACLAAGISGTRIRRASPSFSEQKEAKKR